MGLHAETLRSCRIYTLLLIGCVSHSWKLTWQSPVLYILLFSSFLFPIFPPKKKSHVEKAESACAELDEFIRVHGEIPSQLSDLTQSRAIYSRLRRLKLLHLLKQEESHVAICKATDTFFQKHSRLPKRQNPATDEQRAEDALARRWDRLLTQRTSLPNEIQERYRDLFDSADMADTDAIFVFCLSVQHFFNTAGRLPRRQAVNDQQQHEEDRLAWRWHRLLERHDWLQVVKSPRLEVELLQVVQSPQSEELRRMLTDLLTVQHRDDVLRGRVSPHTCVDNLL